MCSNALRKYIAYYLKLWSSHGQWNLLFHWVGSFESPSSLPPTSDYTVFQVIPPCCMHGRQKWAVSGGHGTPSFSQNVCLGMYTVAMLTHVASLLSSWVFTSFPQNICLRMYTAAMLAHDPLTYSNFNFIISIPLFHTILIVHKSGGVYDVAL